MTARITALMLPMSDAQGVINVEVELAGAQANAIGANIGVQGSNPAVFNQISPLLLPGQLRLVAEFAGTDVEVTLTGAQIRCEGQHLLGAHTTISLDAAVSPMRARISDIVESRDDNLVLNADATTDVPVNYEVDPVSGFKAYPSDLVQRWDGQWVRKESLDPRHPQEFAGSRRGSEGSTGGVSPEPSDTFISTSVSPEDL